MGWMLIMCDVPLRDDFGGAATAFGDAGALCGQFFGPVADRDPPTGPYSFGDAELGAEGAQVLRHDAEQADAESLVDRLRHDAEEAGGEILVDHPRQHEEGGHSGVDVPVRRRPAGLGTVLPALVRLGVFSTRVGANGQKRARSAGSRRARRAQPWTGRLGEFHAGDPSTAPGACPRNAISR
jgi:hypothetical protein